jgi:dynein heavy chain, axonemal
VKIIPYKDSGTAIVGGVDDVQAILDDQIVKIQAINASPFVAPFRERAASHEATLQTLQVHFAILFCHIRLSYLPAFLI